MTGLIDPVLVPGTVQVWTRGFRLKPDCSHRYFLEFLLDVGASSRVFSLTGDTVDASSANPWSPPGSGLSEPPTGSRVRLSRQPPMCRARKASMAVINSICLLSLEKAWPSPLMR